jgi:hypothetical protein
MQVLKRKLKASERKPFFFEKKNQKTFINSGAGRFNATGPETTFQLTRTG